MRGKTFNFLAVLITFIVAVAGTIYVYPYIFDNDKIIEKTVNNITLTESDTIASPVSEIYDATVYIQATSETNQSNGSGFIYKEDKEYGYILTNNHVVENHDDVVIINATGQAYKAVVLGTDIYSDIAVLRIKKDGVLKVANIGDSNDSKIGDTVFTVGSPLGIEYMNSITKGTLSGKDRTVTASLSSGSYLMEVIQVDAAINPGNSGGPLCNLKGEVIGINSLKLVEQEVEGMGFAIPIKTAMEIANQLEIGKVIERPYIGVSTITVTDTWQLYKNGIYLDDEITKGIVLIEVQNDSVMAIAGLKDGDVLIEMDGVEIKNSVHFKYLLYKHKIGDTITLKYYRDKEYKEVKVLLDQII